MIFKSPIYYSPRLYEASISLLHPQERYELISKLIEGKSVLELGCGTGHISKFIEGGYRGIDINERFISYARKRGRNVEKGDIYNLGHVREEVILVCDLLHHLPDHESFLDSLIATGKEVIISEPFDRFPKLANRLLFIVDSDGVNDSKNIPWFYGTELKKYFEEKGAYDVISVKDAIIAVFNSKEMNVRLKNKEIKNKESG